MIEVVFVKLNHLVILPYSYDSPLVCPLAPAFFFLLLTLIICPKNRKAMCVPILKDKGVLKSF